jgi:predicted ester cyclase
MTVEENKELIRRYVKEIYNKQDLTNYSEFVSDEMFDFGVEHLEAFFTAFPDVHTNILDIFGEGDKVIARLDINGTNTGSFAGQPPTGKKVNFHSFRIYRIVDHKIVESWAMQDRLGLMEQLGFVRSAISNINWGSVDED